MAATSRAVLVLPRATGSTPKPEARLTQRNDRCPRKVRRPNRPVPGASRQRGVRQQRRALVHLNRGGSRNCFPARFPGGLLHLRAARRSLTQSDSGRVGHRRAREQQLRAGLRWLVEKEAKMPTISDCARRSEQADCSHLWTIEPNAMPHAAPAGVKALPLSLGKARRAPNQPPRRQAGPPTNYALNSLRRCRDYIFRRLSGRSEGAG